MLSPFIIKVFDILPDKLVLAIGKKVLNNYLKKYANIKIQGFENAEKAEGPIIFVSNHLSNSDGLILSNILKEKYDPYFVAGVKLNGDPITKIGMDIVKHIAIKPDSADKEAINNMVKACKNGENLLIFPEGTRSRTGAMIEAKKGILLIVRLTKATIVPIGMSGTDKLLPISKEGDMGGEEWCHSDVNINFGEPIKIPAKNKEESKHEYEERCMNTIMKSIAVLLPESYRGVYK